MMRCSLSERCLPYLWFSVSYMLGSEIFSTVASTLAASFSKQVATCSLEIEELYFLYCVVVVAIRPVCVDQHSSLCRSAFVVILVVWAVVFPYMVMKEQVSGHRCLY